MLSLFSSHSIFPVPAGGVWIVKYFSPFFLLEDICVFEWGPVVMSWFIVIVKKIDGEINQVYGIT